MFIKWTKTGICLACCMRLVHFCCPVEESRVNRAAMVWQTVHTLFPPRAEQIALESKCHFFSDNLATLFSSLFSLFTHFMTLQHLVPFLSCIYLHKCEHFLNIMLQVLLFLLLWSPPKLGAQLHPFWQFLVIYVSFPSNLYSGDVPYILVSILKKKKSILTKNSEQKYF